MTNTKYERILEEKPFSEVSFGYNTIRLFSPGELSAGQVGYSVDPQSRSLVTGKDGDWQREWIVIGHDEICGDPIFIDTSDEDFPVYTAAHGEGTWDPTLIGDSVTAFFAALGEIQKVAAGRDTPVAFENNPLPEATRLEVLASIQQEKPQSEIWYWENFLEQAD